MSFECGLDAGLLRVTVAPPFSALEIEDRVRALFDSPDWMPGPDVLVEIRGSQNSSAGEIRRYASLLSEVRDEVGRRIAICADNDLAYGLSRMFAVFVGPTGFDVGVFRDVDRGRAWILDGNLLESTQDGQPTVAAGES